MDGSADIAGGIKPQSEIKYFSEGSLLQTPPTPTVGYELDQLRRELMVLGRQLTGLVETSSKQLLEETVGMLHKQAFQVAVIGQIKAGKSTFINAFIQQPEFLPTDVNPWTTAVTRLHFQAPAERLGPPDLATGKAPQARFTFFGESEWQRLAEGGGRLRELTERLVPGFEPELLRQQIEALRRRAEKRLGESYDDLLGQSHDFGNVDTQLLRKYVCAGSLGGIAGCDQTTGQYSDITKSADILCEAQPFRYPLTILDTPGTNDPFLLRDEITRRSLDAADLYVVVLTARQPLCAADLALLRILRGLHKDRILVFINRIDDLDDIAGDLEEVRQYVSQRLAHEFPGSAIPVIAGSARWACAAKSTNMEEMAAVLDDRIAEYLSHCGLTTREDIAAARALSGERDARKPVARAQVAGDPANNKDNGAALQKLRAALSAASGIPSVYTCVSDALHASHCAHVMQNVATCYRELAHGTAQALSVSVNQQHDRSARSHDIASQATQELSRINGEVAELTKVAQAIERSSQRISEQLTTIIDDELRGLRAELLERIRRHAADECAVVIDTLRRGRGPREWHCEAIQLRRQLAEIYLARYREAAGRVVELQARITPELRQLTELIGAGGQSPPDVSWGALIVPSPSLAPLSTYVALDLESVWWRAWVTRQPAPEERGAEIAQLISSEFQGIVDELMISARTSLQDYARNAHRWSFAVCSNLIETLQSRTNALQTDYASLQCALANESNEEVLAARKVQLSKNEDQLVQTREIEERLGQAAKRLHRLIGTTQRSGTC